MREGENAFNKPERERESGTAKKKIQSKNSLPAVATEFFPESGVATSVHGECVDCENRASSGDREDLGK